ncbi:hypothetical protein HHK36_006918 [Tetracentron sinense]|uniref:PB1 domain-containing protein n=1 Tax=Tetracentron sinense TaxID=13715 RepID=A0A834ZSK9_TETSI|nr:hypothetical protein HHK36_006918 [Tetracentron sinense]
MEPPLSAAAAAAAAGTPTPLPSYPDSVDSSPRYRNADSWDEPLPPLAGAKLRLMCSYGGHIIPRPHDKSLCYLGGDTRIIVVDRHSSLADLSTRLSRSLLNGRPFTLKYQLPNEDLDSLISVTTDEDLENMVEEYDRTSISSLKPSRLRLFLFPSKPETAASIGSLLDDSKSESWFFDALNGSGMLPRGISDPSAVNCLLGLDDAVHVDPSADLEARPESGGNNKQIKHGQDVHSVHDSPMLETNSSFGSSTSSRSPSNLPPIRVYGEDGGVRIQDQKVGLNEHFSQMGLASAGAVQKQDEGFGAISSATMAVNSADVVSENPIRVFSDDERSEQGTLSGFGKPPQPPPPQLRQKPSGGIDLPSPDSVASDNSIAEAISRPKPVFYQDPVVQIPSRDNRISGNRVDPNPMSNISDPSSRIQLQQQVKDSAYVLPPQLDQIQQQNQQQFIHSGMHYMHHPATGPVPISSYYPMYPQQIQQQQNHQLDQQYQMYFMPVRQTQAYNSSVQSNMGDTTNPAMISPMYPTKTAPPPRPELGSSVYGAATAAAPPLVHVPSNQQQQQYVGYNQIHHPSQSVAGAKTGTANYAYEFADPARAQIYYTQPLAATLPPQYQTMTSSAAVGLSDASKQIPVDNTKQQIRPSQPL